MTEILLPPPAEAMTFVDESINTVDDGYFAVNYTYEPTDWQNSPTVRHGNSGVFGFADAHAERWRWRISEYRAGRQYPLHRPPQYLGGLPAG